MSKQTNGIIRSIIGYIVVVSFSFINDDNNNNNNTALSSLMLFSMFFNSYYTEVLYYNSYYNIGFKENFWILNSDLLCSALFIYNYIIYYAQVLCCKRLMC